MLPHKTISLPRENFRRERILFQEDHRVSTLHSTLLLDGRPIQRPTVINYNALKYLSLLISSTSHNPPPPARRNRTPTP
jgi:hypothetical protein